ncbi:putative baseplate assembly protein [Nitrosospira briensis]|uniref:putative baseplate assembly protein n=1 Tax=Nitrosospira briensis TaxID=35799 RepID=UPI0008E3140C|nr:putative baseplate assembly protein [Nitrosospira briensis]SFN69742.1 putative baseplate assembly protein [Nitrosospira briensis]
MNGAGPACAAEGRRDRLFDNPDWNGIDFVEVSGDQRSLCVHFFGRVPEHIKTGNIRIEGGRRIRDIRAVGVRIERAHDEELDDCLHITFDKPGDFSTYRLCLVQEALASEEGTDEEQHSSESGKAEQPLNGLDPRYSCIDFSFKVSCPSDLDCKADTACPPETFPAPEIDYLAKDYASFRQLILDRLALTMPDWRERHIPDIGITLVELLAYVADYLSYYQDAVATEAYLDTARQRISVRRHARLVDYRMHEGNNARAWVTVWTATDLPPLRAKDFYFITGFPDIRTASGDVVNQDDLNRVPSNLYEVFEPLTTVPDEEFNFRAAHSEMYFYTWGDNECCLPKGTIRATLLDEAPAAGEPQPEEESFPEREPETTGDRIPETGETGAETRVGGYAKAEPPEHAESYEQSESHADQRSGAYKEKEIEPDKETAAYKPIEPSGEAGACNPPRAQDASPAKKPAPQRILNLQPGDVLIFEEVLGPTTNNPADADPSRRHAVRLTKVTPSIDGLLDKLVLEIEWAFEDALPFSLCLSVRMPAPDCRRIGNMSVARGNVVLVDHGRHVDEPVGPVETKTIIHECACEGSVTESTMMAARFNPALKHAPLTFGEPLPPVAPASALLAQDPRRALPRLRLQEFVEDEASAAGSVWLPEYDLLDSAAEDRHFVAETDDDGRARLRFGDGDRGRVPAAGVRFTAEYRVGNGPAGNVGRDTINYLVLRESTLSADLILPRNPLPAFGGTAPEPAAEVKLFAPHAFRTGLGRAITAEDYATLAARNSNVQNAMAELRWAGSWYEARVAVYPLYKEEAMDEAGSPLLAEITEYLYRYRRMGHDLAVTPAHLVPLRLAMEVCVLPQYARGQVKRELLRVFSSTGGVKIGEGRQGFFHPDNLSFGGGVHLSQLIAIAKSVEGVETVRVMELQRLGITGRNALETGVLALGPMEIAQLDNDLSFPENGRLELTLRGGK